MMNKFLMLLTGAWMLAAAPASAENRRKIGFEELPAPAQHFVKGNFADERVTHVWVEGRMIDRDYEVVFADGSRVEFDKNGQWEEIGTKYGKIPASVLPQGIRTYLRQHYSDQPMRRVERDRKGYEVELGNGVELDFGLDGQLLKAGR